MGLDGCVEGMLVLADIPQGTVKAIHRDPVLAMPGVLAVLADEAMVRRSAQGTAGKAPVQDVHTVDYFGQPVALVVAETFEQARDAALALRVEYDWCRRPGDLRSGSPDAKVEQAS